MALVKCIKCDKEYSNTLDKCPHCGFQIKVFACEECGFIHGRDDTSCSKCGYVFDSSKEHVPSTEENTLKYANFTYESLGQSEDIEDLKKAFSVLNLAINQVDVTKEYNDVKARLDSLQEEKNNQTKYEIAKRKMEAEEWLGAQKILLQISGYLDSDELANECKKRMDEKNLIQKKKRLKIELVSASAIVMIALLFLLFGLVLPASHYRKAVELYNNHQYEEAYKEFSAAGNYKSSKAYSVLSQKANHYTLAEDALKVNDYELALNEFTKAEDYSDAPSRITQTRLDWVEYEIDNENYLAAYDLCSRYDFDNEVIYDCGKGLIAQGDYENAYKVFEGVNEYYQYFALGLSSLENGNYSDAVTNLGKVSGIKEADDYYNEAKYLYAGELASNNKFDDAISYYTKSQGYADANEKIKEVKLSAGIYYIEAKMYVDAYGYLFSIRDVEGAQEYFNIAALMKAEDSYRKGKLNEAFNIFSEVEPGTVYADVSRDDRLATLNKYSSFMDICGKWKATEGYMEVKEQLSYTSSGWSSDSNSILSDCNVEITCKIDEDNNNVVLSVRYTIRKFDNYSSFKEYVKSSTYSAGFLVDVSSLSGAIDLDANSTMKVTNDGIVINYQNTITQSTYSKEIYTSNYTYGMRTEIW